MIQNVSPVVANRPTDRDWPLRSVSLGLSVVSKTGRSRSKIVELGRSMIENYESIEFLYNHGNLTAVSAISKNSGSFLKLASVSGLISPTPLGSVEESELLISELACCPRVGKCLCMPLESMLGQTRQRMYYFELLGEFKICIKK